MPNFIAIVNFEYGGRKPYTERRDIRFESPGYDFTARRMALAQKTQAIIESSEANGRPVRKVNIERVFDVREFKGF